MIKKNFLKLSVLIGLVALLAGNIGFSATKVRIVTEDYEPYTKCTPKFSGVFIEVVEAAFKEEAIVVEYQRVPWKRANEMALNNEVEATIPWFKTVEREKVFLYSSTVVMATNKFFIKKNGKIPANFAWQSLEDFKQYKMGGTIGYWYEESFKKAGLNTEMVPTDDLNMQKLADNRIDAFVTDEMLGWLLIKKYFPNNVKDFMVLEKPYSEEALYLMIGKTNPKREELMNKFNSGLKKIKANGSYQKIVDKYL